MGFLNCDLRFKAITEQPTCLSRGCERQGYCQQEQRREGPKALRSSRLFHKDSSSPVPGCRWKGMRYFRQNQNLDDCLCFQLPFCFIVSDVNRKKIPHKQLSLKRIKWGNDVSNFRQNSSQLPSNWFSWTEL